MLSDVSTRMATDAGRASDPDIPAGVRRRSIAEGSATCGPWDPKKGLEKLRARSVRRIRRVRRRRRCLSCRLRAVLLTESMTNSRAGKGWRRVFFRWKRWRMIGMERKARPNRKRG